MLYNSLTEAAGAGDIDAVTNFLDNGANINGTNKKGLTPIMLATWENNVDIVKLLIDRGADLSGAMRFAKIKNNRELINLLK